MVETHGLTHVALSVRDPDRSARFYEQVVRAVVVYRADGFVQVQTPGSRDVVVFQADEAAAGREGGIAHFGFRLVRAEDIDATVRVVEDAGGKILRRGEFGPGEPYVFFTDPDGYEVEIWVRAAHPARPDGRVARNLAERVPNVCGSTPTACLSGRGVRKASSPSETPAFTPRLRRPGATAPPHREPASEAACRSSNRVPRGPGR